jgi:glycosyltransferase involved in cell wall biosynthesis
MDSLHQRWLARTSNDTSRILGEPLVSIICFCKDRAATIRRCVNSVLGQTYRNIEFVVQDGASTDGTVEILRSYGDPRVKLVSERDSGPAEGFWKVLQRCQGDIIGTCLSDEELLSDAVERAVGHFRSAPQVAAITCDGFITDTQGRIVNEFNAGDFNLVDYLFGRYCPFWPGSFFRRQALLDVGLKNDLWTIECLEFETWCRLATRHEVKYVAERMSKYCVHETQLSQTRQYFHEHFDNRARVIRRMFSRDGFFGDQDALQFGCLYNQLYLLYNHVRAYRLRDQIELLGARLGHMLEQTTVIDRLRYKEYFDLVPDGAVSTRWGRERSAAASLAYHRASVIWMRAGLAVPPAIRALLPRRAKQLLRAFVYLGVDAAYDSRRWVRNLRQRLRRRAVGKTEPAAPPSIDFSPYVYHEAAKIYYARGQIEQALQHWRRAEALQDPVIDGLACQAMLMAPSATYAGLRQAQERWAARHAQPLAGLSTPRWRAYDGRRRIRVAYWSVYMSTEFMNFMMLHAIRLRDRNRFEVYGYSPTRGTADTTAAFDMFRVMNPRAIKNFVSQVRGDEIDILVEISGFSPHNCYAAMASRCAPVQISYLNHTGTSAVPNVDYVLADAISVPPEDDQHFTEQVWRLPGSFLCYYYNEPELPPVADVPSQSNGFITFGYFGSGGKLNTQLIELWSEVMKRVPDSMFFIRNAQLSSPDNRAFLQDRFWRFGIAPERLRILPGADRATVLRGYDDVDISLDTWPYCGGNTIAEALWQGVPVVTLKGNRFSGNYGASLLSAAGCPELIARSADEYLEIVSRLAASPDELKRYRANLRTMVKKHGLSDPEGFARKLEAAYIEMMTRRWNVPHKNPTAH